MKTTDEDRAGAVTVHELHLDPGAGDAWWQGAPLDLHPSEFRLLLTLARRSGQTVSTERLAHAVWGSVTKASAAYVALYAGYLRAKLEAGRPRRRVLYAVRGGYRLSIPPPVTTHVPAWWSLRPG